MQHMKRENCTCVVVVVPHIIPLFVCVYETIKYLMKPCHLRHNLSLIITSLGRSALNVLKFF